MTVGGGKVFVTGCASRTPPGNTRAMATNKVQRIVTRRLLDGITPDAAIRAALGLAWQWDDAEETIGAVERAQGLADDRSTDHRRNIAAIGQGWVGEEALAIALYAVLVAGDFADAIRIAANHDGDSDSTASIAGHRMPT